MFKNVIWATDGSEHADRAMTHAVEVAKGDGAELEVVHIVEKLVSGRAIGLDAFGNEAEIKAKIEGQAKTIAAENGLKTSIHVVAGMSARIGDRIAEIADTDGGRPHRRRHPRPRCAGLARARRRDSASPARVSLPRPRRAAHRVGRDRGAARAGPDQRLMSNDVWSTRTWRDG